MSVPGPPRGRASRPPQLPYRIHAIDLRGTDAGALRCPTLQDLRLTGVTVAPAGAVVECAQALGSARNAYATNETVQDLEALRLALGVERLAIAAGDYGSYIALRYAQSYPDRVERLLLESVIPREGVGTRMLATYPAIRAALQRQCAAGRCRGVTGNAISALRTHAVRAGTKGLEAHVFAPSGTSTIVVLDEAAIFDVVREALGSDRRRYDLVPALAAAAGGDELPLARLSQRVRELDTAPATRYSYGTHAAALCADLGPPGAYGPPLPADVEPFSVFIAERNGLADACARWPATTAPPPPTPLPAIPTLLVSGEYDVATPAALANVEAARIPGATSLIVPGTGHLPLLNGFNDCARLAAARFLAGRPIGAARPTGPYSPVGTAYPSSLSRVPAEPGVPGAGGRIVGAAYATVIDMLSSSLRDGTRVAGLRGGWGVVQHGKKAATVTLSGAELVPGVKVRGTYVRTYAHVVVKKGKRVRVPEAFTGRFTLRGPGLAASFTLTDDRRIRGQRDGTPFAGRLPTAGSLLI